MDQRQFTNIWLVDIFSFAAFVVDSWTESNYSGERSKSMSLAKNEHCACSANKIVKSFTTLVNDCEPGL